MTGTNQKLREAFESRMTDNGKWPNAIKQGRNGCYLLAQTENAWTEWQACAEALALPTADHLPDAGKMVVDHFPDATKMIETAAPVGERELPPLPEPTPIPGFYDIEARKRCVYTADQMRAYARAALSAGDAVDAQRYRWLKGRSQVCLSQVWFGGYTTRQRDGDFLSRDSALSAIESAIDAAMRKDKP